MTMIGEHLDCKRAPWPRRRNLRQGRSANLRAGLRMNEGRLVIHSLATGS